MSVAVAALLVGLGLNVAVTALRLKSQVVDQTRSFTIRLKVVAYPKAYISSLDYPEEADAGEAVLISAMLMNTGVEGNIWGKIIDEDTGDVVASKLTRWCTPFTENYFSWSVTMPSKDLNARLEVGHDE